MIFILDMLKQLTQIKQKYLPEIYLFIKLYASTTIMKTNDHQFVPPHRSATLEEIKQLQEFIITKQRIFVITGAGISTESGIPDYRSEGVGLYARTTNRPMMYQEFLTKPERYRMYWARKYVQQ